LGTQGLKTLTELGGMEQGLGQRVLDQPMQQAQNYAKLLQGYQVPTSVTKQTVGSTGYSTSPLAQITGLLAGLASFGGGSNTATTTGGSGNSLINSIFGLQNMVAGGNAPVNNVTSSYPGGSSYGYADGGEVSPQVAYTDGQGNYYDASGYLVE